MSVASTPWRLSVRAIRGKVRLMIRLTSAMEPITAMRQCMRWRAVSVSESVRPLRSELLPRSDIASCFLTQPRSQIVNAGWGLKGWPLNIMMRVCLVFLALCFLQIGRQVVRSLRRLIVQHLRLSRHAHNSGLHRDQYQSQSTRQASGFQCLR